MDIIDLDDILNRLENFKKKKPNKINTKFLIDSLQNIKMIKILINKTNIESLMKQNISILNILNIYIF